MQHKTVLVGIAGGTGSGKTTVARKIIKAFNSNHFNKSLYFNILYL